MKSKREKTLINENSVYDDKIKKGIPQKKHKAPQKKKKKREENRKHH